ncbi:hypothetical protein HMPREF0531_11315, partial [Lactiplantibacillus plantarum subsp. plantarum ATCC 14917 = JCM 1149 = CGMCC 1.2437]
MAVVLVEFVAGLAGADRLPLTLGSGVDGDDSFGTAGVTAVGFSGVTVPGLVGLGPLGCSGETVPGFSGSVI